MAAQIAISKNIVRSDDEMFLSLIDGRRMGIEDLLSTVEMNQGAALLSIQRLIQAGFLHLLISVQPWGVEFEIQQTEKSLPQMSCKTHERSK